jgi:4-aminobutyrate aminotransferase
MAKGLASGLPLSAIATRKEYFENAIPGSHGGTYGGNIVACAAAEASIRVYVEEKLAENAERLGQPLLARLKEMKDRYRIIGDVRGLGLMAGVEFVGEDGHSPSKEKAKAVQRACIEKGLLLLTCGTDDNVIRWIPPLIINDTQLHEALGVFEESLEKVERS